jgi:hypothetical protein
MWKAGSSSARSCGNQVGVRGGADGRRTISASYNTQNVRERTEQRSTNRRFPCYENGILLCIHPRPQDHCRRCVWPRPLPLPQRVQLKEPTNRGPFGNSAAVFAPALNLSRGKPQPRCWLRSVCIPLRFPARHLRYLVQEFPLLRREIAVSARFDLPPPSLGRHGKQSLNHVSHFLPRNRTVLVLRQPVICGAGVSRRFMARQGHRRHGVVYARRSLTTGIARILLL